jgi:hypothetical protein
VWPWIILLGFRFRKISFEGVELLFPEFPALLDPGHGVVHRSGPQPAAVDAPGFVAVE